MHDIMVKTIVPVPMVIEKEEKLERSYFKNTF